MPILGQIASFFFLLKKGGGWGQLITNVFLLQQSDGLGALAHECLYLSLKYCMFVHNYVLDTVWHFSKIIIILSGTDE